MAEEAELDLVVISPNQAPPVAKRKKLKKQRKNSMSLKSKKSKFVTKLIHMTTK